MKNYFSLYLFIISVFCFSQQGQNETPDFAPPSPQAYEISKYGDIQINESTGKLSHNIPLYNYNSGKINLPISLSYMGNGVKIENATTWLGDNWTLNAGGVITREVRDLADETLKPRYFLDEQDLTDYAYYITEYTSNEDTNFPDWLEYLVTGTNTDGPQLIPSLSGWYINPLITDMVKRPEEYDTQSDIFNFSFGGYSGKFYLDIEVDDNNVKTVTPVIIKKSSELKIKVLGDFTENSHYEFVITTPDGLKYFFGGYTELHPNAPEPSTPAIEETQLVENIIGGHLYGPRVKSAFYLEHIEDYLGNKVYLDYYTKNKYEVKIGSKNEFVEVGFGSFGGGTCNYVESVNSVRGENSVFNGKYLKHIWGSQLGSVFFNSYEKQSLNQYYRVLTSISLPISSINLEYWPTDLSSQTNIDHFFLTNVNFKDNDNHFNKYNYSFEYDDLENFPLSSSSFAQDYLGYYNGEINNSNLIPDNSGADYLAQYMGASQQIIGAFKERTRICDSISQVWFSNREPYFEYAKKGSLKRINYPTGGFTDIEYEPVDLKTKTTSKHLSIYSNMSQASPGWIPNSKLENIVYIGSDPDLVAINPDGSSNNPNENLETPFFSQEVSFAGKLTTLNSNGLDYRDYVYLRIKDLNTGVENILKDFCFPTSVFSPEPDSVPQTVFPVNFTFSLIKDHNYKFELGFGSEVGLVEADNDTYFSNTPMYLQLGMTYKSGLNYDDGLGIRVKRTKDYSKESEIANYKRYYYTNLSNINTPRINKTYKPSFLSFISEVITLLGVATAPKVTAKINSKLQVSAKSYYGESLYKYVTISYGDDNFINGGIEKQFSLISHRDSKDFEPIDNNFPTQFISFEEVRIFKKSLEINENKKSNFGECNGDLERERVLMKRNDTIYKIKEMKYNNHAHMNMLSANHNMATAPEHPSGDNTNVLDNAFNSQTAFEHLFFGLYDIYQFTPHIGSKVDISYIDAKPLVWENSQKTLNNPYNYHGWPIADHDQDGDNNFYDEDYLTLLNNWDPSDLTDESNYRKITTTTDYKYESEFTGQPTKTITSTSDDGKTYETVNRYVDEASSVADPNSSTNELANYTALKNEHRINTPIQTESYIKINNNLTLLSKNKTIYADANASGKLMPSKIQTAKDNSIESLEDRVEFVSYDLRGNPTKVKKTDGSITKYFYNSLNQVTAKIENFQETTISVDLNNPTPQSLCEALKIAYPNSLVTYYTYDSVTNLLIKIFNPNCQTLYYEYDNKNRLKYIKDKEGNILSKNDYNYRTQN